MRRISVLRLTAAALTAALGLAGCSTTGSGAAREGVDPAAGNSRPATLDLTGDELDALADRPDVLLRVRSDPYAYFRLLASGFSRRVCAEFDGLIDEMPLVNLHGDAHLEQYAITPTAHGLDDFDEAGMGPAIVDLVRFASSIHFACRRATFDCDPEAAVNEFLEAYAEALADPESAFPTPDWVARERRRTPADRTAFLAWAESLMKRPDPRTRARMMERWALFVQMMNRLHPDAPDDYYGVERFGAIDIGIGSALDAKYLLRIRGDTADPEDDVIVEIKPMNEVTAPCLLRPPSGGMLLTLLPTVRMGRLRPVVLGYLPWEEGGDDQSQWWIHSWDLGYRELDVDELTSQGDLAAIARDVGLQLGRGHVNGIAAPLEDMNRLAQARTLDLVRERVEVLAKRLADEAYQGWVRQMGS
ncbi:MAG TPA: DUF2252 family protein [Gemmatimonadota bacterium]|nr:DUF2252 family protein [Gemmatimonadota bacterium]